MKTTTKKANQNGHAEEMLQPIRKLADGYKKMSEEIREAVKEVGKPQTLADLSLMELKVMICDEHEIMMAHEAQFKAHQANWMALRQERVRREAVV